VNWKRTLAACCCVCGVLVRVPGTHFAFGHAGHWLVKTRLPGVVWYRTSCTVT
jgi:hypothetical protein